MEQEWAVPARAPLGDSGAMPRPRKIHPTEQGRSVITICNYAKYQDITNEGGQATEQQTGQQSDSDRTAKEHPAGHMLDELNGNIEKRMAVKAHLIHG